MKRLIITVGAGFISSAFIRHIINLDKLTYAANLESLESIGGVNRYTFEQEDIW